MKSVNLENYTKEKRTVNLHWANVFGLIVFIPTFLIFGGLYWLKWGNPFQNLENSFRDFESLKVMGFSFIVFIICFAVGIVVHELIHGIFFAMFAKNGWKSIKFGILKEMLTPYCHCKEPLKVKHYIIGAAMPGIILGIIPAVIAIITGSLFLLVFGIIFTVAACGDILIINLLLKENINDLAEDHPSEVGFYIYGKKTA